MTAIKIDVKPPLSVIIRRLEKSGGDIGDFTNFFEKGSILLDQWVQRNFRAEGSELGSDAWAPFKAGGRRIKGAGLDTSAKLLQDTGRLRASHLPFSTKIDAGIGSDLPYSKFHNEGLGHLPKRRTLPEHTDVDAALTVLINQHLQEIVDDHAKG